MPRIVSSQELEQIAQAIARHPEGIGMDLLLRSLGEGWTRRTLQRRLTTLIAQGRIESRGEARAIRYSLASHRVEPPDAAELPVSPEGEDIRRYVRQPRQRRDPVGYKQAFLEHYTPNGTAYLPESLRAQLHALGRPPIENTPAGTFARDILNRLLIDLSWASSQLEGNTYTRLDTERLIEFGQAAAGKDALETQMILNHKAAIEYLVRDTEHVGINPETVVALHAFLSDGLLPDPASCGRLRNRPVEIGGSVYLPVAMP